MTVAVSDIMLEVSTRLSVSYDALIDELGLWARKPSEADILSALSDYNPDNELSKLFTGLEVSDFWAGWGDAMRPDAYEPPKSPADTILMAFAPDYWSDLDGTKYELINAGLVMMRPEWFVLVLIKLAVGA